MQPLLAGTVEQFFRIFSLLVLCRFSWSTIAVKPNERVSLMELGKEPVSIYLSYSSRDKQFAQELLNHLSVLRRSRHIEILDQAITPGSSLSLERDNNLNQAHLILLLISPDFLASDYLYSIELRRAL